MLLTARVLSSPVLLNDKWQYMGLWLTWCVAVVHGVEGLKEMFSLLETWGTLDVHLRGLGMLNFTATLVSFIFQGECSFKSMILCGHKVTK